jgi:3-hydroxyisobutyrate dehydrogenase-like beta-hydroxyacid dehydrogenase
MKAVGFVGLGVMGRPMAGHLCRVGLSVVAWNRTAAKAAGLEAEGARVVKTLADVGSECGVVMLCVNRTEDVMECLSELTSTARPGTLFVDHSTIAPDAALRIHDDLKAHGFRFVDAPITGGSMGAQKGQLTIFCGGEQADVDEALPILKAYAKRAERVGGPGAGQMMKAVNQIAVGGALLGLCESLAFAKKAGLDVAQAKDIVGSGAAGSWAFDNYGPKILAEDWSPGFSIKNQLKDFRYCVDAAEEIGAALPGTKIVQRLLDVLAQEGHGEWTTAALYRQLMEMGPHE